MEIDKNKSEKIVEELRKSRQNREIIDVEEEKVKLVLFTLCGEHFAFNGDYIKEILLPMEITFVPGAPDFILGVINVRGDIESVISVNKLLGLPDNRTSGLNRILIAGTGDIRSGILVDSIVDVEDVPLNDIKPPLPTVSGKMASHISGELLYKGKSTTIIDLGRLFGEHLAN